LDNKVFDIIDARSNQEEGHAYWEMQRCSVRSSYSDCCFCFINFFFFYYGKGEKFS